MSDEKAVQIRLDQRADVHWYPGQVILPNQPLVGAMKKTFGSLRSAINFIMHDLDGNGTASIQTDDDHFPIEKVREIYAKRHIQI